MPSSRAPRFSLVERPEHDRRVAGLQAGAPDRLGAERVALRRLLGADIAAAELRDDLRHRHVLVHHLDAGLRGLLGERHDRGVAGMAHHGDAVRLGGDRLAQLLHHLLRVPAREDVVDLRAGVVRRPAWRRCRRSCRRRRPRRRRRRSGGGRPCTTCRAALCACAASPMRQRERAAAARQRQREAPAFVIAFVISLSSRLPR